MAEVPKKNSLLRAALEALTQGNHAEAVSCCKRALKQDRLNYDAYVVLGKSLFAGKQFEQADISYRRAIDINRSNTKAWQGLAELHEATGNYAKVVEACNSVIHAFQSKGDLTHMVEYSRKLGTAYAALQDHQNALEAWKSILEINSVSETFHLEALCGVIDSKAVLMESWIEENCKMYLSQDKKKNLNAVSARHSVENIWASSKDSLELEKALREVLEQIPSGEKYEMMLLQLLVWRMRANSSSKGQEWCQVCLQLLQLCLSALSWHASNLATMVLLALCEEDNVDDIFIELGMVELAQGRVKRLHILGKRLIHAYPDKALVMPILAFFMQESPSCSVSLGQKRSFCEIALRLNENSILGWQVLAKLRASEGSHSSAIECIRRGLQVINKFRDLYGLTLQCAELQLRLVLGDLFFKSGNHDEAAKAFHDIIKVAENRQDMEACKVLALAKEGQVKIFLAEGRVEEASSGLVSLLSLDKGNSWALAEQGWLAYEKKDYEQATTLLQQAVDLKPSNANYHYRLGLVYWNVDNQKAKALSHLLESARLDSSQSEVFRALGHYYKDLPGSLKRAIRCYQKAISINCEDAEAGEALCDLLDSGGQEVLELTSCREASERSPRAFWAFRRLGYIQVRRKEWSDAAKNLQHAVRGYPTCADVWEALGLAYQHLGMLTAALKAYGRVLTITGDCSLYALQQSGNILLMLGLYRKAVTMFQTALEKTPEHPAGLYGLASALLGQAYECKSMGAIRWCAALLQEASTVVSCSLAKCGNIASVWKLLGDIEISYARSLPWEPTSGTLDGDSQSRSRDAQERESTLTTFCSSLKAWKEHRLEAALKAKGAYQHALHLQPQKSNLYADLCLCLDFIGTLDEDDMKLSTRRFTTAEAIACCGLALEGSNANLWTSLGVVANNEGVRQHAFIQALHVDGNHALAWAELGQLYLKVGKPELAKEAFTRARSADPALGLTWAAMSSMHASSRIDEMQEALASILYAAQLSPVANFQLGLAKIAATTQQLDSAQVYAAVEQAVIQAPHRPEVHNFKGLVCELQGKFKAAATAYGLSRAALDLEPSDLKSSLLKLKRHAASMNVARALCKAGDAHAAIEEYEMLAKLGHLEDSSALRGYAMALWQTGQQRLAMSIAKVAMKKSAGKLEVSAAKQLLVKFAYFLSGPEAALEDMHGVAIDLHAEPALAIIAFAIAAVAGKFDFLLQKMSTWAVLFCHDKAAEFASLVAASMQLPQNSQEKIHHAGTLSLFQKTLHMHPQSLSIRTKLMQLLLERSNGLEIDVAARCCCFSNITRLEKADDMHQLCQMLSAAAVACSVCGNIKPRFSFSSCKSYSNSSSKTIQVLQRWMHLEPWNVMSHYHLALSLMQQAREEKFPVSVCGVLRRMVETILAKLSSADDTNSEIHKYMHLQTLLCKSEVSLHIGNDESAVESAAGATYLELPQNLLALPRLQLTRCHAVKEDSILVDDELQKVGTLSAVDFPTLLCALDLISRSKGENAIALALKDFEFTAYEGDNERIPKALLEWKKAEIYIRTGDLSLAEKAALNAAALWPEADCLHLFHGALCMELVKSGSGSMNLSFACRRLMKVGSGSGNMLPIAGLLLAQAQAAKAGTPGWERLLRDEWAIWPEDYKPAELCFQMGILGRVSKGSNCGASEVHNSAQSPRAWFRRAVHINPSCARYWNMLQQGEAADPID
eukprot:c15945_g1_i1 orf=480-5567(-)